MRRSVFAVIFAATSIFSPAMAQACLTNMLGQVVCAQPGGGAAKNALGQIQTGPGQCVTTNLGQVMCSAVSGGGAAINGLGQAVCVGGCVPGR